MLKEETSLFFRGGSRSCTHWILLSDSETGLWSVGCETGDDGPWPIGY